MRRRPQQLAEGAGSGFADGLDQLLLGVHDVGAVAGDRLVEWLAAEHQEDDEALRRSDGDLLSLVGEKNKAVFRRLPVVDDGAVVLGQPAFVGDGHGFKAFVWVGAYAAKMVGRGREIVTDHARGFGLGVGILFDYQNVIADVLRKKGFGNRIIVIYLWQ